MLKQYSIFATAPIGPSLVATDSGLTLTTTANALSLARAARSDVAQSTGTHGAEFTFWGDGVLAAAIGVLQPGASLAAMVGGDGFGIGWQLDSGKVFAGGAQVASGLPVPAKGEIVGVRVLIATATVEFYRGAALVHSRALPAATWHFGVSLGSTIAGDLSCAVNSGQWQAFSAAALASWAPAPVAIAALYMADHDWLSAGTDAPANTRLEGLIDGAGINTVAALAFWPWGGDAPTQGGAARVRVLDAEGLLDTLAQADVATVPVAVRMGTLDGTLASSTAVARYVCAGIEVEDDGHKTLHLVDAHDDLDQPLARGVFLPSIPSLAWRPQPVVIGAVASVPALPANSDGSVAFLSDAPLAYVDSVLDRGDAMEAGTWAIDPSGQQLLLEQPPVGPVVADCSSIGNAMQPATLAQFLREVFRRIDKSAWSLADAAAIDVVTGYAGVGYYNGDGTVSVRAAMAAVLPSYGAWWWQDGDGVLRFARTIDPASVAVGALAFDLVAADLAADLVYVADDAPNLTRRMAYRPNARVLTASELVTDLVDVPHARRIELTSAYRGLVYGAGPLPARYARADTAAPFVSTFWYQADAQAEIDRVIALYAAPRYLYRWAVKGDQSHAPTPGPVGRITYPRYGLEAGKQVMVRAIERNPATGDVVLTLWG